ncbi:hypothetical protein [Streptomyces sp. WAC01280]|uniref:hypothetical protein n=1 Tax=Streptomyces sp. WAC01280 TaxID=2487424 RepID=UPI000F799FE3|nr:hypothetical protein [Streptomyces sp. WAC01280]RSS50058.1 hypothetical protein EF909_39295 [Streptomyces sp. WAC01280]
MTRRLLAEHEAAHAVVAAHYGQTVDSIRVGQQQGETRYSGTATPREHAAISAAGDLFNRELGTVRYEDFGCGDLADIEREHGLHALWRANRDARAVLVGQRQLVLDLADRLMDTPVLQLG